jgi:ATP-dependent exoDNAse (exonuclease V) alpha subunit
MPLALAGGDRVLITAGGKTKDGKHRLSNGSLYTIRGFTRRGGGVDHGWVIDRDFGHLTHGYVITSHASQGVTVDKVFVAVSSESLPATCQRTAYVAVTRGREQAQIFTDDRKELLKAVSRADNPLSATELAESTKPAAGRRGRLAQPQALARQLADVAPPVQLAMTQERKAERGLDHDR